MAPHGPGGPGTDRVNPGPPTVRLHRHDSGTPGGGTVAELVLDRPEALNALSTAMANEIASATDVLANDTDVRAVVLSSSRERAFCVGADLKERRAFSDAQLLAQRPVFRAAFSGVLQLPMPVVAAVAGFALGGGYELALACDFIVADETAIVGLPEVTVGLIPGGGGTQTLARRVGVARATDLIATGRHVGSEEAERWGLVDRRVAGTAAREEARAWARAVAANSPVAVRQAKWALRAAGGFRLSDGLDVEDECWRHAAMSPDRGEGVAAWNERRPPRWSANS
jgi:enoyl-CoA hydratase/carnithine racemase